MAEDKGPTSGFREQKCYWIFKLEETLACCQLALNSFSCTRWKEKLAKSLVWWWTPVISELRRLEQENCHEFQHSLNYTVKPCVHKPSASRHANTQIHTHKKKKHTQKHAEWEKERETDIERETQERVFWDSILEKNTTAVSLGQSWKYTTQMAAAYQLLNLHFWSTQDTFPKKTLKCQEHKKILTFLLVTGET